MRKVVLNVDGYSKDQPNQLRIDDLPKPLLLAQDCTHLPDIHMVEVEHDGAESYLGAKNISVKGCLLKTGGLCIQCAY